MNVRFNKNPDGEPHVRDHHVEVSEVLEALEDSLESISGGADTTIVIGRTRSGRMLKIVHAPSRDGDGIFVVTAFDLPAKQIRALKRRLRRRGS